MYALFLAVTQAAGTAEPPECGVSRPPRFETMHELIDRVPKTSQLRCIAPAVANSSCAITDLQCICTNEDLNLKISDCILRDCSKRDALGTCKRREPTIVRSVRGNRLQQPSGTRMNNAALIARTGRP